jgi:hypothetical protein
MGEWRFDGLMRFSDAANRAEAALRTAASLGVRDLPGRFAEYLPLLRQADSFNSCPLPWPEGSRERALFVEGCSQVWHLLKAGEILSGLPLDVAGKNLAKALAGHALPEVGCEEDREARDRLVEFATGYLLKQRGFAITMTIEAEDVRATSGARCLVVECKRPESVRSMRNGIRKGCDQLKDRCDGIATLGMLVLGMDRILSETPAAFVDLPGVPSFRDKAALMAWVEREFRGRIGDVLRTAQKERRDFMPEAPFVGLLLTVPTFVNEGARGGFLQMLDFMAFFNTGPIRDSDRPVWEQLIGPGT